MDSDTHLGEFLGRPLVESELACDFARSIYSTAVSKELLGTSLGALRMTSMNKPRVFIADDHSLVLQGLCQLLAHDTVLVGTANSGAELLLKAPMLDPDIILLDVSMPDGSGFEVMPALKEQLPRVKIIFLTMLSDPCSISEGFHHGAHGYVLKQSVSTELLTAIYTVMSHRRYVSPEVPADVRDLIEHPWIRPEGFSAELTPRQREVLRRFAGGCTKTEIAAAMGISKKTVEFHYANVAEKLGLKTAAELTRFALAQGLTAL